MRNQAFQFPLLATFFQFFHKKILRIGPYEAVSLAVVDHGRYNILSNNSCNRCPSRKRKPRVSVHFFDRCKQNFKSLLGRAVATIVGVSYLQSKKKKRTFDASGRSVLSKTSACPFCPILQITVTVRFVNGTRNVPIYECNSWSQFLEERISNWIYKHFRLL